MLGWSCNHSLIQFICISFTIIHSTYSANSSSFLCCFVRFHKSNKVISILNDDFFFFCFFNVFRVFYGNKQHYSVHIFKLNHFTQTYIFLEFDFLSKSIKIHPFSIRLVSFFSIEIILFGTRFGLTGFFFVNDMFWFFSLFSTAFKQYVRNFLVFC